MPRKPVPRQMVDGKFIRAKRKDIGSRRVKITRMQEGYSTIMEKQFIDSLGSESKWPRSILLTQYIRFMDRDRHEFRNLKKKELIRYARESLQKASHG
jgi:hypothetical protein